MYIIKEILQLAENADGAQYKGLFYKRPIKDMKKAPYRIL